MPNPISKILATTTGWLVSPKKDRVLSFIKDPKSKMSFPDVMNQLLFCTIDGIPKKT